MKYIYKMSFSMYLELLRNALESRESVEEYITKTFGLLGECVKVEVI